MFAIMRPAPDAGPERYRIFPAEDERILRSVRKIVRGLSRYHNLSPVVADGQVFADVQREEIPEQTLAGFEIGTTDSDICAYAFLSLGGVDGMLSAWVLQFFGRTNFLAMICADEQTRITKFGK
ncbi:hypothetical protein [Rhizobium sp. SL86]|uniref:hypothetical protein n=1 Tax=Rhizobium sp. SL86 TaxID=2995148 RepID=UPI0022733704|nr:hypothetical protein [Rhizobium sp. SL86]MCY1668493.1 hypothetical protein [Rhizobium sp. SL86]MCY1669267.1 hypothetical protein [Rhizobium sp. SL86]